LLAANLGLFSSGITQSDSTTMRRYHFPLRPTAILVAAILTSTSASAQSTAYWSGHLSNNWFEISNEEGFIIDTNWVNSPGASPTPATVVYPTIDTVVSFTPSSTLNLPNTNASDASFLITTVAYFVRGVRTEAGLNTTVNVNGDITGRNLPLNIHSSGISHNGGSGLVFNSPVVLNANQTWHVEPGLGFGYIGLSSTLTGSSTVTKTGGGTVEFSSNNTAFTGTYVQSAGATQLIGSSTFASTNVNLTDGLLTIASNNRFATLSGSGNATIRPVGLNPLNLTIGTDGTNAPDTNYGGNLANNSIVPAGTLSLTIASAPTRRVLFLSKTGGASYSGATTIRSGAFIATTAPNALSPNSPMIVEANGSLDISGNNQTIPSLTGAGRVYSFSPANAILTVGSSNTSTTFTGTFINAGGGGTFGLTKVGTGTLTLTSTHTYTGPTVISGGNLDLSSPSDGPNLGLNLTSSVTVNDGATLRLLSRNAYAGGRANVPPLTLNPGGTVTTASGIAVTLSTFNLNGGTLSAGTPDPTFGNYVFNSAINVNANTTLTPPQLQLAGNVTFNTPGTTLNISGNLANVSGGTGSITKTGDGTLVFNRNHSFTGLVTINGGTLSVVDLATLPNAVTINAGILALGNGPGDSRGNATGPITIGPSGILNLAAASSTGPITNNGLIRTGGSGQFLIASNISGTGSLQQQGSDGLFLTGNNTYTGTTTISNSRFLYVGNQGSTGSIVSNVTLADAGTLLLFNRATDSAYPGNISGPGQVHFRSTGILTLTGNNTSHTGPIIVDGGTLGIGSNNAVGTGTITVLGGGIRASGAPRIINNPIVLNGPLTLGRSTTLTGSFAIGPNASIILNNADGPANDFSTIFNLSSTTPGASLTISAGPNGVGTGGLQLFGTSSFTGPTNIATRVRLGGFLPASSINLQPGGTFQIGQPNAAITSISGTGTLLVEPLSSVNITGAADSNLLGQVTGAGGLNKSGPGSLFFGGTITHSGTMTLAAGPTTFATPYTTGTSLSLLNTATVNLSPSGLNTLATRSLSISPNASVNLNNNDLLLNYTGTSPISTLIEYFQAGQLQVDPDLAGLPTTLAISEAADLGLTDFNGIAIDATTVIAKYTFVGDANLDGQVDALDYERIDLAIGNTGVFGTAQGDLNYDGNVDALDYEQVDLNIGNGVGSPLGSVFIPEPTLVAPLAIAALAARRRR
jgi:autotransporter-associated beta strand protein